MPVAALTDRAVEGIVFDFDGTLTEPHGLDFAQVRAAIGCPAGQPILEFLDTLPPAARRRAAGILDQMEFAAAEAARPASGVGELLEYLQAFRLPFAVVTRNSLRSLERSLRNFPPHLFPPQIPLLTRDDDLAPKPDPAPILEACRRLGLGPEAVLTVGDFRFDIEAGRRAGTRTLYLRHGRPDPAADEPQADFTVDRLGEVLEVVERLRPLPEGKLPNAHLGPLLAALPRPDAALIVGPAVGEDFAAVALESERDVLILKSDPITFAAADPAASAVAVNANDVAVSGAVPRWMLATLLLPVGAPLALAARLIDQLGREAAAAGLTLCGGHSEITSAVTRPVVVASVAGTVARTELIEKARMAPGDRILVTKAIPIEGLALVADELRRRPEAPAADPRLLDDCRRLARDPGISIVAEARIAARHPGVTGMHDVTEGGIATALSELSLACGRGFRLDPDRIPRLPQARPLLEPLGLSALGLIGSGSLLIVVHPAHTAALIERLTAAGIPATEIGEVLDRGPGIQVPATAAPWPVFARDELARLPEALGARDAGTDPPQ